MFVGELVKGTLIVAIAFVSRLLRVMVLALSVSQISHCVPGCGTKKNPLRMILYIFYHLLYSEGQAVR